MWPSLTSDQELLRDTTARFLADRVPLSRQRKELRLDPAGFDPGYWQDGIDLGWAMLLVAEERGGGSVSGRGLVDLAMLAYEFGRHAAPGPLVDTNVVAAALSEASLSGAAGEMAAGVLGEVMGGTIASVALGAAPWMRAGEAPVTIRRDGGDVVIDGVARPVESGAQAGWLLVTGASGGGMSQVLVPAGAAGLTIRPLKTLDVTRRFAGVRFEGVRAPAAALVGGFGAADGAVRRQVSIGSVLLCAEACGAMDALFAMTLDWMHHRYAFGRALASYQALKHRMADMKAWVEAAHAVSDAAAEAVADDGADGAGHADDTASAAKSYLGEKGPELGQESVQLHGGIGVTYEHDLHFFLRRVTLNRLLYGTPAEHRRMLAQGEIAREMAA